METHQLMFELSHPIRYEIMKCLEEQPLRLTKIGEQVDANNPEVSRHLDRLKNADLVGKGSDGRYFLTDIGVILLILLPSFSFVAHHPEFIKKNDLTRIPPCFISRLGELVNGEQEVGLLNAVHHSFKIIRESEERLFIITNETNADYQKEIFGKIKAGIHIRTIIDTSFKFPTPRISIPEEITKRILRVYDQIPVVMIGNEKEAGVSFPIGEGKFNFFPRYSTDPAFIQWCNDLFEYLWIRGDFLYDHPEMIHGPDGLDNQKGITLN